MKVSRLVALSLISSAPLLAEPKTSLPDVRISSSLSWIAAQSSEKDSDLYMAQDHPMVQRLQFWADSIDQILRRQESSKEGLANVPRPQVRLLRSDRLNASASSATVCFKVPVRTDPAKREASDDFLIAVGADGRISRFSRRQVSCLDGGQKRPAEALAYFRENFLHGPCQMDVDAEGGALVLGTSCARPAGTEMNAGGIVVQSQTPFINLNTGLIKLFADESHLVYTLMHELAHFYRAHGPLYKKAYHYFYRLQSLDLDEKPAADPALSSLGEKLLGLPSYRINPVAGQSWHSEIFSYSRYALNRLVKPACGVSTSPCFDACQSFQAIVDSQDQQLAFGRFPASPLPVQARPLYFRWEAALNACFSAIRVEPEEVPEGTGSGSLSQKSAREVFWWASDSGSDLKEIAQSMNQKYFERDHEHRLLLQEALDQDLGYYTSEEEADLLALRWLAKLGIDPRSAIEHWLLYGDATAGGFEPSPYLFEAKYCRRLYEADPRWSEAGQGVKVPIGSFSETHHSSCFRAWRMDKEASRRVWELGPPLWNEVSLQRGSYRELRLEFLVRER